MQIKKKINYRIYDFWNIHTDSDLLKKNGY